MNIKQAQNAPLSRGKRWVLDFFSLLFVAATIGVSLLFAILFIYPQSRFNPLPPLLNTDRETHFTLSSTPRAVLPPTWTPAPTAAEKPVSHSKHTGKPVSNVEISPVPAIEPQSGISFREQGDLPNPEAVRDPDDAFTNIPESAGQIYTADDDIPGVQLGPRLNQPQLAAALAVPIQTQPYLPGEEGISDIFTPEIQYWEEEILAWAEEYELDPNLIATVMQIESCGYTRAKSIAGAMGLFQVMPHNFKNRDDPYDPDTNAYQGLSWLRRSLQSGGSVAMALAGYNAGIARATNPDLEWPSETRRYVFWGLNIYEDAIGDYENSYALNNWLSKGGSALCKHAANEQQGE